MPQLTNRQMKAQQTKQRILVTALSLFSQKGYDNVTVDEIVSTSGASKGAFYGHFNSKYEIFLEKFKEIDNFYIHIEEELKNISTAEEKIVQLALRQMDYLKEELGDELMRTLYINALTPDAHNFLADRNRSLYVIIEQILKEGQTSGELDPAFNSNEITLIISRCMRGTLFDSFIFTEKIDLDKEIEQMLRLIFSGLKMSHQ
ncbi:TetR family transcriptional regulator [Salsuginibacillus halophilus]|uniref:TetR family transcriptional regulator n=1 Tax=Salsuginibacillus halophilus TaxID=517424 RepID=A0A2P8HWJ4_9BACI|nr:TetR/AcrR family transcriptional regulator [Salsuginibacillus halophilus]PSL50589.1 TetR family transcriptional regulator [Salsuginibacillus halophilus]